MTKSTEGRSEGQEAAETGGDGTRDPPSEHVHEREGRGALRTTDRARGSGEVKGSEMLCKHIVKCFT